MRHAPTSAPIFTLPPTETLPPTDPVPLMSKLAVCGELLWFWMYAVLPPRGGRASESRASLPAATVFAVVPIGVRHFLEAGSEGASIIVAMLPGTRLIRDDGSGAIPDWVR